MVKHSEKPLRPNPFTAYRDPETGAWVVIKPNVDRVDHLEADQLEANQLEEPELNSGTTSKNALMSSIAAL